MESANIAAINLTEMDKHEALSTFISVFAMTKIKMMMKRYLKNIRARIAKKYVK